MFLLGFILFVSSPKDMAYIWMHLFHIPRSIIGLLLLKRLPRSHDIVDQLQMPPGHVSLEQLQTILKDSVSQIFINYTESCRHFLVTYMSLTIVCLFIDVIDFIVQFVRFGRQGDEYSEIMMLFLVLVFLGVDLVYFIWGFSVKSKFRPDIAQYLSKAVFGFASIMKQQLT